MFRKPKAKGAIRQRKNDDWDENSPTKESSEKSEAEKVVKVTTEKRSTFSFDMDEGADSTFEVKKNKKKVEELKRMHKLEEQAEQMENERRIEEESRKKKLESVISKEKKVKEEKEKDKRSERQKYLEKYKDASAKHVGGFDEDLDIDEEAISFSSDTNSKFSSLAGIPDSKAVYEAKKRRERMRREGRDGYIPLDDDQKIRNRGARDRLIREDENDDSDEEEAGKFYSARELLRTDEDRRREEQNEFLNREHGDDNDDDDENSDYRKNPEMEEWEKQQIRKAVSGRAIGQLREEKRNTTKLYGHPPPIEDDDDHMDIDMDVVIEKTSFNPKNTGGVVKIEDILAKLKLRLQDRDEALNFRREEMRKMKQHLDENKSMVEKIEMEMPSLSTKFAMYQELRVYARSLLECLNEKVAEINEIADKKRTAQNARMLRIAKRRRMDVRDQYAECTACAAGKNISTVKVGEAATRAAEREARRGRRWRERETTLVGISHEEGMSTDDEEMNSQIAADKQIDDEVEAVASVIFADALEEYSDIKKVLERMMDWLAVDTKSFQDAYVYLCLPKLCSPYVRLQLITADILRKETLLNSMPWFKSAILAGANNSEIEPEHVTIVGLVPAIVEKIVCPFLIDLVRETWDPLSLSQTRKLMQFCADFDKIPTLNEKSKQFVGLLDAIRCRIQEAIDDDLFVPMFAPTALENTSTGCKLFQDRQYWTALKLIKSINCLSPLISVAARFELIVEKIVNGSIVVALRTGVKNDVSAERKIRALIEQLDEKLLLMGGMTSLRQLTTTLSTISDAQNAAGREFYKEIRRFIAKIER
ncbi:unnamed protein product [Caenorhabditis bovis]|uniref:GCF C-terminal domain-containing protein n=1 Tax=Caenorhabditis bovis TaxID=2654633 RepID=A0A8S1F6W6_9PELO|nr:unnamed protein product [Caenorhabditis bovis]